MILASIMAMASPQTAQDASKAHRATPIEDTATWITDDDYPLEALRRKEAGTVGFKLIISAEGEITDCQVTSSVSPILDQASCALLTSRAHFRPALDDTGKPIASQFNSRINWSIPEPVPVNIGSWHSVAMLKMGADGVLLSCHPETVGAVVDKEAGGQCGAFQVGKAETFITELAGITGRPFTFVVETALIFDGLPGIQPDFRYSKPGYRLVALKKMRFEVSEEGRLEHCEAVATGREGLLGGVPDVCDDAVVYIPARAPDGSPRRLSGTFWMAASLSDR